MSVSPSFTHLVTVSDPGSGFGGAIRTWVADTWPDLIEADWSLRGDWRCRWTGLAYEVSFTDPNHALLFKLAWGGK